MRRMHTGTALVLGGLLVIGLAGCGGSSDGEEVATAGGDNSSSATSSAAPDGGTQLEQALEYAECMRENGVPNFPDPNDQGQLAIDANELGGPDDPTYQAAAEACEQYLPGGGEPEEVDPEAVEQARQYAQCMRENGVPNFPDPSDEGGLNLDADTLGMDPNDPAFRAAEEACRDLPGAPSGAATQTGGSGA
jgi:hypothetical protein